jgi:hypothetical protein
MVLVRTFDVAGFLDGNVYWIATSEERASTDRAGVLAQVAIVPGDLGAADG